MSANFFHPNYGGDSGGDYLNDTYGSGEYDHMMCVYDNAAFCKPIYLVDGICHQGTNRLLYSGGNLVSEAQGYSVFYALYGHYGNYWSLCKDGCENYE